MSASGSLLVDVLIALYVPYELMNCLELVLPTIECMLMLYGEPCDLCIASLLQNVLLQIGLNLISPDGMVIKEVRTYVLQCKACFK